MPLPGDVSKWRHRRYLTTSLSDVINVFRKSPERAERFWWHVMPICIFSFPVSICMFFFFLLCLSVCCCCVFGRCAYLYGFVFFSVCVPIFLSVCFSVCLSVCVPICMYLCLCSYLYVSLCPCVYLYDFLSVCLSVGVPYCMSFCPCAFVYCYARVTTYLSLCPCAYLQCLYIRVPFCQSLFFIVNMHLICQVMFSVKAS